MLSPQITEGVREPGFEMIKVSVKHCEADVTGDPAARSVPEPEMAFPRIVLSVEGPLMTNWLKSSLS